MELVSALRDHFTGTRVGDPTEVMAAGRVSGLNRPTELENRLIVGSVKTNIDHLEGACALPGILKVVAAIEAGQIPPTLGFKSPNPRIDFDKAKARVNNDVEPWPKDRLKRASVTSAGFGGTNGHCVIDHVENYFPGYIKPGIVTPRIDEVKGSSSHVKNNGHINGNGYNVVDKPQHNPATSPRRARKADARTHHYVVLPFSAHNQSSLKRNMETLSQTIGQHSLADVTYTLAAKRSRFIRRAFAIVDTKATSEVDAGQNAKIITSPQAVKLGFVFTGQGAQWNAMGKELFEYGVFRNTIAYLDWTLGKLPLTVSWTIADVLRGDCEANLVQTPAVSQTLCTALQVGLIDLLASWGIRPAGVVGHSSGEMAAAYAAGRVTAAEAITAAYYRGYTTTFNKKKGAMLAVGVGPEEGADYIYTSGFNEKVEVVAVNSPDSITMSGDADAIQSLADELKQHGVFNRLLNTGGLAYHSHHMLALGGPYNEVIDSAEQILSQHALLDVHQRYPWAPWFSSVTPEKDMTIVGAADRMSSSYWRSNLESPVHFTGAVSKILDAQDLDIGAVLEIGPHPTLKTPVSYIAKSVGKSITHVASIKRGEDGQRCMVELAGTLFAINADVDLVAVNAIGDNELFVHGSTAVDLPPYQFTYGPINYHESRHSKEYRLRNHPRHDLLGAKIPGTTRLRPQWRNILSLKNLPWLDHHRMPPHVLHPGAAHIVMAMLAAEQGYSGFPGALPVTAVLLQSGINHQEAEVCHSGSI